MLALLNLSESVADRGERRPYIFERRFPVPQTLERLRDCAEYASQRRIEGERAQERLRLDQLVHVATQVVDAEEEHAVAGEELAAVRPGDGADNPFLIRQRVDQGVRRLVGRFRRRRIDDDDHQIGPLREQPIELDLLLTPRQRARQQLAAVGVDGDIALDVDAGERRRDEEGRNDDPRVAGRQAHDPHDRGDD